MGKKKKMDLVQGIFLIAMGVAIVNYVAQLLAAHTNPDPPSTRAMLWNALVAAASAAVTCFLIATSKQYLPPALLDLGGSLGLVEPVDTSVPVCVDRF